MHIVTAAYTRQTLMDAFIKKMVYMLTIN